MSKENLLDLISISGLPLDDISDKIQKDIPLTLEEQERLFPAVSANTFSSQFDEDEDFFGD